MPNKDIPILVDCFIKHIDLTLGFVEHNQEFKDISDAEFAISQIKVNCLKTSINKKSEYFSFQKFIVLQNYQDEFLRHLMEPILDRAIESQDIISGKLLLKVLIDILESCGKKLKENFVKNRTIYW